MGEAFQEYPKSPPFGLVNCYSLPRTLVDVVFFATLTKQNGSSDVCVCVRVLWNCVNGFRGATFAIKMPLSKFNFRNDVGSSAYTQNGEVARHKKDFARRVGEEDELAFSIGRWLGHDESCLVSLDFRSHSLVLFLSKIWNHQIGLSDFRYMLPCNRGNAVCDVNIHSRIWAFHLPKQISLIKLHQIVGGFLRRNPVFHPPEVENDWPTEVGNIYCLGRKLGSGSFGEIYYAVDSQILGMMDSWVMLSSAR